MEKFKIGNAVVYGKLVCKPSQLTEVDEDYFFKALNKSLKNNELEHFLNIANKKSKLKKGITIGNDYFIIERV
jgi:hypothetical protein